MDARDLESALMQHLKWRTGSVDAAKAKLRILAETVVQPNLRFSNFIVEGNFIDLMIAIVRIIS